MATEALNRNNKVPEQTPMSIGPTLSNGLLQPAPQLIL